MSDISIFTTSLGMPIQYQKIQMQIRIKFCFPYRSMKSHERRIIYPPKESSLKNLSEGSHWFEYSLIPSVIVIFFGFPLGTRLAYCVVGGGWGVFGVWRILAYVVKKNCATKNYKNAISRIRTQALELSLPMPSQLGYDGCRSFKSNFY